MSIIELGVIDRSSVDTASSLFNWKKHPHLQDEMPSANEDGFKNLHGLSEQDIQSWKYFLNMTQNNMLETYENNWEIATKKNGINNF